jgi:hypothetical protein
MGKPKKQINEIINRYKRQKLTASLSGGRNSNNVSKI